MKEIKNFKDIQKYAGAKYQVLLVRLDSGDIDEDPYEDINKAQGALDALSGLAESEVFLPLSNMEHPEITALVQDRLNDARVKLEEATSELDSIEYAKFHVRGFTPHETLELQAIVNTEKPEPPIKMREVGWEERPPLEQRGPVQPPRLRDEPYADDKDPVYLRELKVWEGEQDKATARIMAYTLMKCVQGCDLTDEEITSVLNEEAHAREPIEEFRLRIDQVADIVTNVIAMPVWIRIQEKISSLTGVSPDRVDFTSLASPLRSYAGGRLLQ